MFDSSRFKEVQHTARVRTLVVILVVALLSAACSRETEPSQVTQQPAELSDSQAVVAETRDSVFGLRARVSYADIEAIAAEQLPEAYPVVGTRRLCKRVLGINACGTAQWNLIVTRDAPLKLIGQAQRLQISTPIRFNGTVGVQGRVARALGLSMLNVFGTLNAHLDIGLIMQENWCPYIQATARYSWLEKPTALWGGRVDFDLENLVNEALDKQLSTLEPRLNKAVNCDLFQQQLATHWRIYTFALDLPTQSTGGEVQQVHLNIKPSGFGFSGIQTEADRFGVSFEIVGSTVVASAPLARETLTLPRLKQVDYQASKTDFDLLLRADYEQLEQALVPILVDRNFTANSVAGPVSVQISALELSGNTHGVTLRLVFVAQLPGSQRDTHGIIYLEANPVVDSVGEQLRLEDIRLSKVLDSELWNLISTVFEGQIISALEKRSVLDLSSRARNLETMLLKQLQNPTRTGGVTVRAENLSIRLVEIIPESKALAARARVSAELDVDIPLKVLQIPLSRSEERSEK